MVAFKTQLVFFCELTFLDKSVTTVFILRHAHAWRTLDRAFGKLNHKIFDPNFSIKRKFLMSGVAMGNAHICSVRCAEQYNYLLIYLWINWSVIRMAYRNGPKFMCNNY